MSRIVSLRVVLQSTKSAMVCGIVSCHISRSVLPCRARVGRHAGCPHFRLSARGPASAFWAADRISVRISAKRLRAAGGHRASQRGPAADQVVDDDRGAAPHGADQRLAGHAVAARRPSNEPPGFERQRHAQAVYVNVFGTKPMVFFSFWVYYECVLRRTVVQIDVPCLHEAITRVKTIAS